MVVVGALIGRQLPPRRFFERRDTPFLNRVCGVGPDPFPRLKDNSAFFESTSAAECPGIVDTASVTKGVVHNQ